MRHTITALLLILITLTLYAKSEPASAQLATAELTYPTEEHAISSTQQFWRTHIDGAEGYSLLLRVDAGNVYTLKIMM